MCHTVSLSLSVCHRRYHHQHRVLLPSQIEAKAAVVSSVSVDERERITMETKSASAASPAAAVTVSQRDQMTANDGSFHPHQQQNQQQRITQHRPTVPPKPAAFRDDSQHQQHQHQHQHRSAAVALSSSSSISSSPRRLPLVDLTSRIPSSGTSDLPSPQPQQLPPTPQTPLTPVSPFYQQPGSSPQPVSRLTHQHQHQQQPFDDEQFSSSYRLRNASVGKSEDDSNGKQWWWWWCSPR